MPFKRCMAGWRLQGLLLLLQGRSLGQGEWNLLVLKARQGCKWCEKCKQFIHGVDGRLFVRSCIVLAWWDLDLEFSDWFAIWQASQQHNCWAGCQISKWYVDIYIQSHGIKPSQDLVIRHFVASLIVKSPPPPLMMITYIERTISNQQWSEGLC